MAQSKYKQKTTRAAYTVSFKTFYHTVNGCCTSLSKRKRKWLGEPIMEIVDRIQMIVFYLSEGKITGGNVKEIVNGKVDEIYKLLHQLKGPFYSLWNYRSFSREKMQSWINLMSKFATDLSYRYTDYKKREKFSGEIFPVPNFNKYSKANFENKMYEIHKQVITYAANSSGRYVDSTQYLMVKIANEALMEVVDANRIWVATVENYLARQKKFGRALILVRELGTTVVSHGMFYGYSDASMNKWMGMINEEVKLLNGIIKSEKAKIQKLKQKESKATNEEQKEETKGK